MKPEQKLEEIFNHVYEEGTVAFQEGCYAVAEPVFRLLLNWAPDHPGLNAALGHVYLAAAIMDEAVKHLKVACEGAPDNARHWANLGAAYIRKGDMQDAKEVLEKALEIDPDYSMALSNLGHVYRSQQMHEESMEFYRKAYDLEPTTHAYLMNVANAYQGMGDLDKSREWLEYGISLDKENKFPEYYNNLGNIYNKMGEPKVAVECYDRMLQHQPNVSAAANKALVNLYDLDVTPESQLKVVEDAMKVMDDIHHIQIPEYNHDRPRIGFISAHFGRHPVGFLTTGLLTHSPYKYYVYSNRYDPDDLTEVVERNTHFQPIHGWNEEQLCAKILEDEIDILIDCGGLSGKNSIKIFKRKPAPIQVGWVGYAGSRGMKEIDYLISDWNHTPKGDDKYFTEKLLRFSNDYVTYYPPKYYEINRGNGPVSFIAAHNSCKINHRVLEMWSEVLKRVPESRIIMAYKGLMANKERILSGLGVDPDRLEIHDHIPHNEMMDLYNKADVMLDTYPYSAGLVVCEATYMGLPTVTLPSKMYSGRHAVSHLKAVGLEWGVAKDERDYIEKAVALAKPLDNLTREANREKMRLSPLCDYEGFAKEFQQKMEEIWNAP